MTSKKNVTVTLFPYVIQTSKLNAILASSKNVFTSNK